MLIDETSVGLNESLTSQTFKLDLVTSYLSRQDGGVFEVVLRHAEELMRRPNLSLRILGLSDHHMFDDLAPINGVALSAHRPLPYCMGISPGFSSALNSRRAQIVHLHGLWTYPSWVASRVSKSESQRLVITPHGMLDSWALARRKLAKRALMAVFQRGALAGARCIHALNADEASSIRSLGIETPIAIIPNGVRLPAFRPNASSKEALEGKKTLLFLGRLHEKKGLMQLIEALDLVRRNRPEVFEQWHCRVVGPGEKNYLRQLQDRVEELDLSDLITIDGPLYGSEKAEALFSSSAFILPSLSEGQPIAVLEAWAHSLPAFITAECNLPEGFTMGAAIKIGISAQEIAQSLEFYLLDPELSRYGVRGRALVESHFGWQSIGDQLLMLYDWILNGGAAPGFVHFD